MAIVTLEGTYEHGTVRLDEAPTGIKRARVFVTFVPDAPGETAESHVSARRRAFERMRRGVDLGGKFDRASFYDDRADELIRARPEVAYRVSAGRDCGGDVGASGGAGVVFYREACRAAVGLHRE